jgi:hypothetical protein
MVFTNHDEPLRLNNLISILYSIKSKDPLRERDEQVEVTGVKPLPKAKQSLN